MKKIFSIITLTLFVFAVSLNSCQQKPAGSGETSESQISDSTGNPSTGWNITVIVKDVNQRLVQDASVNLPCANASLKTDANGMAVFNGEGNCPCNADNAATVSKRGMCENIQVPLTNGCGATYSATCQ